jgi:serine/threonine protein kinase
LGEGAYSSVYKVKRLVDGMEYALKKVKLKNLSEKEKQNAVNEVRILASFNHRNVIAYKEAFFDQATNCLKYSKVTTVASSWSTPTMGIFIRKFKNSKGKEVHSKRRRCGACSFKSRGASEPCIK